MIKRAARVDRRSSLKRTGIPAWFFCLLLCSISGAWAESAHPLKPVFLLNRSFSEEFELNAVFGDGTFIQTQMLVTNAGVSDSNAACQIIMLHPGDKPLKEAKRFGRAGWNYADTPQEALSIGKCRLSSVNASTVCTMALDKSTVTLSFNEAPGPVKLPPTLNVGEEKTLKGKAAVFYGHELLIPWSRLQATIRLPGYPEKTLSGFGTLVHTRSVGYPKNFSRGWVYFYGCRSGSRFLMSFRLPPHDTGDAVAGWVWKDGLPEPQPLIRMHVLYGSSKAGGKKETSVAMLAPDSSFSIASVHELCRFSIIDDLGPFVGPIIRLVLGNPVTRFYKAEVTLSPLRPPEEGFLEVMRFE